MRCVRSGIDADLTAASRIVDAHFPRFKPISLLMLASSSSRWFQRCAIRSELSDTHPDENSASFALPSHFGIALITSTSPTRTMPLVMFVTWRTIVAKFHASRAIDARRRTGAITRYQDGGGIVPTARSRNAPLISL
jgi:hypothetical protein